MRKPRKLTDRQVAHIQDQTRLRLNRLVERDERALVAETIAEAEAATKSAARRPGRSR